MSNICGDTFDDLGEDLAAHVMSHGEEKAFNCAEPLCFFGCNVAGDFRAHYINAHGMSVDVSVDGP
jgi:hypothetical protein